MENERKVRYYECNDCCFVEVTPCKSCALCGSAPEYCLFRAMRATWKEIPDAAV